jgi:enolase
MNRAAEAAVVEAKPLLVDAIRKMSANDAKDIFMGPDDAATRYFRKTTGHELTERFKPVVARATAKVQLADKFNALASKAAKFRLIDEKMADLDGYVTEKTVDGLFAIIAEQELRIRQDPVATGTNC